jgi:hypothetical protein
MVPLPGAKRPHSKVSLWVEAGSQAFWSALSRFTLRPQVQRYTGPCPTFGRILSHHSELARLARARPRRR